jgi:hypothetical protein
MKSNLYPTKRMGYYIYKKANRHERWVAQKRYSTGESKSALFYSVEDALAWIDALP